jgi:hypothetical protein
MNAAATEMDEDTRKRMLAPSSLIVTSSVTPWNAGLSRRNRAYGRIWRDARF